MKEIVAYEMIYNKPLQYDNDIICVPFQKEYWIEYMRIYAWFLVNQKDV